MADVKVTALTADTSPTSDDLLYTVNDPGGTPGSRKATAANVITKAHGLSDGVAHIAGGVMASSSVVEGDLNLTDITTANVSTSKHGLAPKSPNDASKYLDGTGAYSIPAGGSTGISGATNKGAMYATGSTTGTSTGAMTDGQLMIGSTAGNPTSATLTAGTNIAVTNAANAVTVGITGAVGAANGGSGQSSYTKGDILAAAGSTTLNKLGVGTDGQVLTADAASTNGIKWAASGGGSGKTYWDTVVAPSGGDYTSLGAAITAGKTSIFVKAGTTSESATVNITTDNTVIFGEDPQTSLLGFTTHNFTINASNVRIENIGMSFTTGGFLAVTGTHFQAFGNYITKSGSTGPSAFEVDTDYYQLVGNYFNDTSSADAAAYAFAMTGNYGLCANNTVLARSNASLGDGPIQLSGANSTIIGNVFKSASSGGGTTFLVSCGGNSCSITGNVFYQADSVGLLVWFAGTSSSFTGNRLFGGGNMLKVQAGNCIVSGNQFTAQGTGGTYGIDVETASQTITGNTIRGAGTTGTAKGIYVHGVNDVVITGNRVTNWNLGVHIDTSSTNCVFTGNSAKGNSTGYTDNGTTTQSAGNAT